MPLVLFPQLITCGLLMPRDEMPTVLEWISRVLPLTYALDAMQQLAAGGTWTDVRGDVGVIARLHRRRPRRRRRHPPPPHPLTRRRAAGTGVSAEAVDDSRWRPGGISGSAGAPGPCADRQRVTRRGEPDAAAAEA